MGLALDEPDESFTAFTSNGIQVYMHPTLVAQLEPMGGVVIDFVDYGPEQRGFMINTKIKPNSSDCASGCGSGGCSETPNE